MRRTGDQKLMQELNRHIVLDTIRKNGPIPRNEIAKLNGFSPTTVSSAVSELLHKGLVSEMGTGSSSGGRKPILVRFDPDSKFLFGVSITNTGVTIAEMNLEAGIRKRSSAAFGTVYGEEVMEQILGEIEAFIGEYDNLHDCLGISVIVPGIVDSVRGIIKFNRRFKLRNVDLKDRLVRKFQLDTWIDNDVNAIIQAEKLLGHYADSDHMVYVKISDSIGGGVIMDGHLLRGYNGGAGEFGSMIMDLEKSGSGGILIDYLSWPAVYGRVVGAITRGRSTQMTDLAKGDIRAITYPVFSRALEIGDPLAVEIMDSLVPYLSNLLRNLICTFDPEVIILGGELVQNNESLLSAVNNRLIQDEIHSIGRDLRITTSSFGEDFELAGAAAVLLLDVFHFSIH